MTVSTLCYPPHEQCLSSKPVDLSQWFLAPETPDPPCLFTGDGARDLTATMISVRLSHVLTLSIVGAAAAWLFLIGREPICSCGYVKFWHGEVESSENSQHLTDWYTFSHVIHGFIFYGLLWVAARRLTTGWRLCVATAIEAIWEIVENSDAVIERYRTTTISLDYYGDSVINSVADVMAMWFGWFLAGRLPIWATVALALAFEVMTLTIIRDGLALNVLMLTWPLEAVGDWQVKR